MNGGPVAGDPGSAESLARVAGEPYLEVFGRFWDGMSYLIVSSRAAQDRLAAERGWKRLSDFTATQALDEYVGGLYAGRQEWPAGLLLWQQFAHAIVEAHGLLDEYLRATFELLALAEGVASRVDPSRAWEAEAVAEVQEMERRVRQESDRFGQLVLWNRLARVRKRFGLKVRIGRPLKAALKHQRWIRNGIVHGRLTPHVVMPDGTIGRMQAYPPPPYIPLGPHVIRGAMSVMLAVHRQVDTAVIEHLGLEEDALTSKLVDVEIERGRQEWFVDPWEAHEEHLFEDGVLRNWRPASM
jgi:hypothetical protein